MCVAGECDSLQVKNTRAKCLSQDKAKLRMQRCLLAALLSALSLPLSVQKVASLTLLRCSVCDCWMPFKTARPERNTHARTRCFIPYLFWVPTAPSCFWLCWSKGYFCYILFEIYLRCPSAMTWGQKWTLTLTPHKPEMTLYHFHICVWKPLYVTSRPLLFTIY